MNSRRSYLDAVNAGRQRRSYASLEQLNRSLESLERRLERNRDETDDDCSVPQPASPSAFPSVALPRTPAEQRAFERGEHFDTSYQAIARDLERVRRDSDSVQAFGKIASEIKGLREELRHQMASSLSREFDILRKDLRQNGSDGNRLNVDVERLSDAIEAFGEHGMGQDTEALRQEISQLRIALGEVAREETVRSVDRRFDELENRIGNGETSASHNADMAALTDRIEQISGAVRRLPDALPLGNLEEKVRALAGVLDNFIEQQDGRTSQIFTHIEERLDEISRAIVSATMAAQQKQTDPEPFERVEARISALAKQIEEITEDRTGPGVVEHLQALAERVDALASQATVPDEAIERLARQISIIADKIDRVPAIPDANEIFTGIEQRLDVLSNLFERRQDDAIEQGKMLFRELERRLNEVAQRIDQRPEGGNLPGTDHIMQEIDKRLSAFAATIVGGVRDPLSDEAVQALESRLENISRRLDQSASQFANIDPELVRNLEAQVSGLAQHLAAPGAALPEFVDISPRLKEIEKSISDSRDSILEAARAAAEEAARSLAANQPDSTLVSGFSDELKALEELTRRSDERNSKTFEAIHDTLLKIVDRMSALERETANPDNVEAAPASAAAVTSNEKIEIVDAPSIEIDDIPSDGPSDVENSPEPIVERTPAQAATAAAIAALNADKAKETGEKPEPRSLFGGLRRAFKKTKKTQTRDADKAPELAGSTLPASPESEIALSLDAPLDPKLANRPLEPGSGAPDLNAIMKRVRDERAPIVRHSETEAGKSDFIAAARRAAQAAAAEADIKRRKSDVGSPVKALRIGDMLKSRRKHMLLGATALVTALAALQLGKTFMHDSIELASVDAAAVQPVDASMTMPTTESVSEAGDHDETEAVADTVRSVEASGNRDVDTTVETGATSSFNHAGDSPIVSDRFGAVNDTADYDIPTDDVKVAAVEPTTQIDAASASAFSTAPIDVPVDAGPSALREAAAAGDAKALFQIGTHYAEGRKTRPDMATAAIWYQKAAELGLAPAQYRIGNMYEKGIGVERDLKRSQDWYLKAAKQGNASAMHNLAVLYAMGATGEADNDAAAEWFIRAAELGVKDSQFNLGVLSAKGVGMEQSLEESYKWFGLVAKTGDKDAARKRDEIANALRPEQLERARAAMELWRPKTLVAAANSIDVPDAWRENVETAAMSVPDSIKSVQHMLNKNGYDAGSADGVLGGKTRAAITRFQKDNGMEPTGKVDDALVRALMMTQS